MAIDREEQQRQQRELEEIRRSFAEMGARMGSLFEPAPPDEEENEPNRTQAAALRERPSRLVPLDPPSPATERPAIEPSAKEPPATPQPATAQPATAQPVVKEPSPRSRPRWWWAAALVVFFLVGSGFGYLLPRGQAGDETQQPPPPSASTATTPAPGVVTQPAPETNVPEVCLEAIKAANQVIFYQDRNIRDQRLVEAIQRYSRASQACNKEASP